MRKDRIQNYSHYHFCPQWFKTSYTVTVQRRHSEFFSFLRQNNTNCMSDFLSGWLFSCWALRFECGCEPVGLVWNLMGVLCAGFFLSKTIGGNRTKTTGRFYRERLRHACMHARTHARTRARAQVKTVKVNRTTLTKHKSKTCVLTRDGDSLKIKGGVHTVVQGEQAGTFQRACVHGYVAN